MNRRGFLGAAAVGIAGLLAGKLPTPKLADRLPPYPAWRFETITLRARKLCFLVRCPNELLRDATVDVERLVASVLQKELAA